MYGFDNSQYYVLSQCPLTALAEETDWTLLADVNEESTTINGDYISVRGNTPENTYVGSFHYAMSDIYLEGGLFQILENIQPLARAATNPILEGYRKVEANAEQIILESALTNVGNGDVTSYSGNMVINAVKGIQTNKLYPIVNNDEYAFVQYGHLVSTVGSYDYNRVKTVGVWGVEKLFSDRFLMV